MQGWNRADGHALAVLRSADAGAEPFRLGGSIFGGGMDEGVETSMLLLTDGTAVLSLAYGPCSSEGNYTWQHRQLEFRPWTWHGK